MNRRTVPLAAVFALNTDLLVNCLEGVSDVDAARRLAGGGNSLAFLAAHLVDTRHYLLRLLGRPLAHPFAAVLADARGIDDVGLLPPPAELRDAWLATAGPLGDALERLDDEALDRPIDARFPIDLPGTIGAIAFLAEHESYHVGQMGFLRRQLGYPAMTYARPR